MDTRFEPMLNIYKLLRVRLYCNRPAHSGRLTAGMSACRLAGEAPTLQSDVHCFVYVNVTNLFRHQYRLRQQQQQLPFDQLMAAPKPRPPKKAEDNPFSFKTFIGVKDDDEIDIFATAPKAPSKSAAMPIPPPASVSSGPPPPPFVPSSPSLASKSSYSSSSSMPPPPPPSSADENPFSFQSYARKGTASSAGPAAADPNADDDAFLSDDDGGLPAPPPSLSGPPPPHSSLGPPPPPSSSSGLPPPPPVDSDPQDLRREVAQWESRARAMEAEIQAERQQLSAALLKEKKCAP